MPVDFKSPVERRFYGAKTHCGHCDAEGGPNRPLMKCAGCALAVFCSKDCQKAAWPEHKMWCRSSNLKNGARMVELMEHLKILSTPTGPRSPLPPPSRAGDFASAMSVTADWRKFFEWHQLTLMDILEVSQRLAYTPRNLDLLRRGELLAQCHFSPVKPSAQPNPANSWYLSHWEVTPAATLLQEHEDFVVEWERQRPMFTKLDADLKKEHGSRYIGCLVMVNRCGVTIEMVLRPIYAAPDPKLLAHQQTKDALSDLLEFFVGCVNTGVVRKRDAADDDAVKPGKLHRIKGVKSGKTSWEWRPLPDEQDDVYRDVLKSRKYTPKTDFQLVPLCYFKDSLSL
ncbi:hypothetical protein K466DRAFT_653654 [Polyporus arcularius HHB13444]|uniref:MYND-type domain-containing protein n=1 Tax=Polyporus arcularius HHB13444 TaxID=1314778 RepID=A0A5C3PA20_9APHY|nr:hypothetical protein K466DRAFT_653654 [Polyporus arcularius HHB13444]